MNERRLIRPILYGLLLGVTGCWGGCRGSGAADALAQAYALGEKYHWQEAMPLVKGYLLAHPEDPAGHFLLGRCYLHNPVPYLMVARGELETALFHLQQAPSPGGLTGIMSTQQLEAAIHRELARTLMRWSREALNARLPQPVVMQSLRQALDEVNKGRALDPESPLLKEMEETLKSLIEKSPSPETTLSSGLTL